ncbi:MULTISPECIES: amino acid ABC transporter permease [unclassified Nocardioides]|uniref:amino acid ABC transporter permease n=1 Tax=unclassified Nocardioides TaxID=2615069 RepID=UPI0009F02CC9|nr:MULTISPECIES: amino acid ABC transporter permease [unclassified Nocardioides]GAW49612.1 Amino acid ABC transporter permease [Nocardioides sp. PD653-B2]GAW57548.1 Amino acid ABC transporter permease [Nocardioides sp. PD653]
MWSVLENNMPDLLRGALTTTALAVTGGAVALATALLLGILLTSRHRLLRWPARCWVEIFRGVSALVLLFVCFYVLPLFGWPLSSFQAATLGLGLNIGAYGADIVKGAIESVPKGQMEASVALNMPTWMAMWRIILPQALVMMLPSLATNQVILLKATALTSLIAVSELTANANRLALVDGNRNNLYLTILVIYFALSLTFSSAFRFVEKRMARRLHVRRASA